jgi:hypothetical protein
VERASFGQGGVADLVVDHHVNRSAGGIAFELAHVQRFGHDALAGKGGIAVQQDGAPPAAGPRPRPVLARPRNALTTGSTASRWLGLLTRSA